MILFEEMDLQEEVLKAITEMGFVEPTDIQAQTIPAILESNKDVIALAQTGTGKTAGFGLPTIQKIDIDNRDVQALVLAPTRELCMQITKDLEAYSKYVKGLSITAVYGGASIDPQIRSLKKGTHIVVGTPGRTLDLIKRKALRINHLERVILDEADEMLNMGFREDLDDILETTPESKQTLLFSATMPTGVRRISKRYMTEPLELTSGQQNKGADSVAHEYYVVKSADRYAALKRLVDVHPQMYGIVFCRTRMETKDIAAKLAKDGYNADALHGDLSQSQRDYVMDRFRQKQLQVLVATDVAARGIDVDDLTHVINYTLPDDPEIYIHRSGRTGRAGKEGISMIISHTQQSRKIKDLEKMVGKAFTYSEVPSGDVICEKRLYQLMDKVENVVVDEREIEKFLPAIAKKLEWLTREELLKRFISVEFNHFLEYYRDAHDINAKRGKDSRSKTMPESGYSRFFINLGSADRLSAANLIGLINDNTDRRDLKIGKIDIQRNFSFFEVDKEQEDLIMESFKDVKDRGRRVAVELSKPDKKTVRRRGSEGRGDEGRSFRGSRRSGEGRKDYRDKKESRGDRDYRGSRDSRDRKDDRDGGSRDRRSKSAPKFDKKASTDFYQSFAPKKGKKKKSQR